MGGVSAAEPRGPGGPGPSLCPRCRDRRYRRAAAHERRGAGRRRPRDLGTTATWLDGPFADSDAQQTRPVEWLASALPYERFDPDLREAFGQQGTVSEISKPHAAQRILDVLGGADASAIHLVLKWSPSLAPTRSSSTWRSSPSTARGWGGRKHAGVTGLAEEWLKKLRAQLEDASTTYVFLHSARRPGGRACSAYHR